MQPVRGETLLLIFRGTGGAAQQRASANLLKRRRVYQTQQSATSMKEATEFLFQEVLIQQ